MAAEQLKALEELRLALMNALTKVNSQIMREKRIKNENVPPETGSPNDPAMPLHSPVEHPDKSKPPANRRARR